MTYIVPNYFLEEQPNAVISSDSLFSLTYSTKRAKDKIYIRNTTHVMVLLTKGKKKLTMKDEEYLLHTGDILLLTQGNYFVSEILGDEGIYEASFKSDALLKSLIDSFRLYMNKDLERKNEIIKLKTDGVTISL